MIDSHGKTNLEFLDTIYTGIIESTSTFFKLKEKKIRKKKAKIMAGNMIPTATHALGAPGWIVRYDFKMAVLAELRKDFDTALKYFISL